MHFFKNNSVLTANLLIGYTMTLEIPVNVNTTLNQKRLPVIPVLLHCMHIKRDEHLATSENFFKIQIHKK